MDADLRDAERAWRSSGDLGAAEVLLGLARRAEAAEVVPTVLDGLARAWEERREERAAGIVLSWVNGAPADRRLPCAPFVDRLACADHAAAAAAFREWFPPLARIVGRSPGVRRVRAQVAAWAPATHPVLLMGESGVGHELTARVLHELAGRGTLEVVHGSGSVDALFRQELFAGAPAGGTLYLSYAVADDRPARALDLCRARGTRLVVGTDQAPSEGEWDPELAAQTALIPALRERFDDLRLLVEELLRRQGRSDVVPDAFLAHLRTFTWVGNVRQLGGTLSRLVRVAGPADPLRPELWSWIRG